MYNQYLTANGGGQGGIRTHGELPPTTVFKTVALNHSATCPLCRGAYPLNTAGASQDNPFLCAKPKS
jgi:hypothetical protein